MEASAGKVILNIGGIRYETFRSTPQAFPGTKLWSLTEPQAITKYDHDPSTREFFFDRSGRLFGQVLNCYSTKQLHFPAGVCEAAFEEELDFWGITGPLLAPCCWIKHNKRGPQEEVHDIGNAGEQDNSQGLLVQEEIRHGCWYARWRPKLWDLFEKPYSSRCAMGLAIVSLLSTTAIIIIFSEESKGFINVITQNHTAEGHPYHYHHDHFPSVFTYKVAPYLLHLELFFILCFTAEFFIRIMCCPDLKKFLKNPLNIADLLTLFPAYIELFLVRPSQEPQLLVRWLGLSRLVYTIKLLKVLRLVETPLMLRVLPYTLKSILREILIFMLIFASEVLFFGALCFYGEQLGTNLKMQFRNIGDAFWWAAITLTTVGYGNLVPASVVGRVIASCTALCGVLTIVVPIPIFLFSFKDYYDAAVIKERRKKKAIQAVTLLS